jgi:hypothetical protein
MTYIKFQAHYLIKNVAKICKVKNEVMRLKMEKSIGY